MMFVSGKVGAVTQPGSTPWSRQRQRALAVVGGAARDLVQLPHDEPDRDDAYATDAVALRPPRRTGLSRVQAEIGAAPPGRPLEPAERRVPA